MKVLIVGASGFLGRAIAKSAILRGWDTYGTYYKNAALIPSGCKKTTIDDLNKLYDDFDLVYITIGNFTFNPQDSIFVNRDIPTKITKKFRSAKIIFISSISTYGSTSYGKAKLIGESIVSKHAKYAIIRFTNLYGKGMNEKSFIPTIIKKALIKKVIILTDQGERRHDYLYINDAANFCIKVGMADGNEIYLGATGKSISNLGIAKIVQRLIPGCQIIFSGKDSSLSYLFNPKDAMKKLSWLPKKKFEDGIQELVNHYESINI